MRSSAARDEVRRLADAGLSRSAIARTTSIPRSTVRGWLDAPGSPPRAPDPASAPPAAYAYLLGIYMGDGHISPMRKGLYRLRVSCDAAYPRLVDEITAALHDVRGMNSRAYRFVVGDTGCVVVHNLWKHWALYLPQHGPGRKHERAIELVDWQRRITHAEPRAFVRGLMHSDGCRFVARQESNGKIYAYVRYSFTNRSEDIKRLYCEHLDLLGIRWIRPNRQNIDVNRRADVAALESFIGPKM